MRCETCESATQVPWWLAKPIIHRGLHNIHEGVVEHSRVSIQRAIASGLPIEIDLESSYDNENFVIHDKTLDRLTNGTGVIRELLADEVSSYGLIHSGEPILRFHELLDLVNGAVPLMIEFKNRELTVIPAVKRAAELLLRYKGEFAIHSFNPMHLEWFAEHLPQVTRGLLTTDTDIMEARDQYLIAFLRNRMRPHYCSHQCRQTNSWTFQWIFELGIPILAFTVRDLEDWELSKAFAANMFFEFICPDRNDWRKPSAENWRRLVGETVDRRFEANQPEGLLNDRHRGGVPWWTANRPWPPAEPARPWPRVSPKQ